MRSIVSTCALLAIVAGCSRQMTADPLPQLDIAKALRAAGASSAGSSTAAAEPTGTGWGTLKGVFKFNGSPPDPGFLSTANKDPQVCGAQVRNQTLVVDPSSKG
ncbi:MAG TPA: hypothetical protein VHZ24_11505, partial [Pirellulales bacterium]|nr:hypothetical protein [Pirellulales bacterium]